MKLIDNTKGLFLNIKLTQAGCELFIIIMIYVCVHYIEVMYMCMCTSQINRKSKWYFCLSSVTETHTYAYTHTHIHTRTHKHTRMYTHIHTHAHVHTHTHTHIHTHAHTHIHTHIHTRMYTLTHVRVYTHPTLDR